MKVERFLHSQFNEFIANKEKSLVLGVDSDLFSDKFNRYCMHKVDELLAYLVKRRDLLNSNNNLLKLENKLSNNKIKLSNNKISDLLLKDIIKLT